MEGIFDFVSGFLPRCFALIETGCVLCYYLLRGDFEVREGQSELGMFECSEEGYLKNNEGRGRLLIRCDVHLVSVTDEKYRT